MYVFVLNGQKLCVFVLERRILSSLFTTIRSALYGSPYRTLFWLETSILVYLAKSAVLYWFLCTSSRERAPKRTIFPPLSHEPTFLWTFFFLFPTTPSCRRISCFIFSRDNLCFRNRHCKLALNVL